MAEKGNSQIDVLDKERSGGAEKTSTGRIYEKASMG